MDDDSLDSLTPDQMAALTSLVEAENARLEEAASPVTHQAFNLGCLVGLLPGGVFLLAILLLSDFSIIGAAIALVLILMGLIAFANLAAMLARRNTVRRVYREESEKQIEQSLQDAGVRRSQFDRVARQVLPPQAALCAMLPEPPPSSAKSKRPFLLKRIDR
jgi:formate hydrogenlyase subunit 3/multisubunit Na+/H+ antiporter MnhD subunit